MEKIEQRDFEWSASEWVMAFKVMQSCQVNALENQ